MEESDQTTRPATAWPQTATGPRGPPGCGGPPFSGGPPPCTRRQWRVLGLVAMASFFEMYDLYLFALTLKQIQADLAIPEASLGVLGSLVRFGALPACIVALVADRVGRRTRVARDDSRLYALHGGDGLRPHGTGVRPLAMRCPDLCGGGDAGEPSW